MAMVSYALENLPGVVEDDWKDFDELKDEDIDCSDIPEINTLSGLRLRPKHEMYKPVKVAVNCKLDADVVAWLKRDGKGYQTRLNAILRRVMLSSIARRG
jgi:uncharacterized protein (DUF4415 family)